MTSEQKDSTNTILNTWTPYLRRTGLQVSKKIVANSRNSLLMASCFVQFKVFEISRPQSPWALDISGLSTFCRFKIHYSQGIYNGFHEPGTPLIDLVLCISSLVSAWRSELTLASPKWFTTTASIRSRQLVSISTHLLHFALSFTNSECFLCISICFQVLNTLPYPIPWIQNVPHFTRAVRNIQLPYIINETSL